MFLALLAWSCSKEKQFGIVPELTFLSHEYVAPAAGNGPDVLRVKLKFTDGDGDIGLEPEQTSPPFDTSSVYYYNFWVTYYERVEGQWVDQTAQLAATYNARIPNLTPEGQNKNLEARLEFDLDVSVSVSGADTVKFDFVLIDRALHQSNVVSSGPVYVPF